MLPAMGGYEIAAGKLYLKYKAILALKKKVLPLVLVS